MPYNTSDKSFLGRITQGTEGAERNRPSGASIAGTSQHVAERTERQAKDTTGDTTNPARARRRLGRVGLGLASLLVVGCGPDSGETIIRPAEGQARYPDVVAYPDTAHGVICYGFRATSRSIACVKVAP